MIPLTFSQVYVGVKTTIQNIVARIVVLLKPNSIDEDTQRREYILNIILTISICLLSILELTIIYNYTTFERGTYGGIDPFNFGLVILLFVGLFFGSKHGYYLIASYVLISIYTIGAIYSGIFWGVSLPMTLLTIALVIITSSILIGSRFGFYMSIAMVCTIVLLGIYEKNIIGIPSWYSQKISYTDIITYASVLLFLSFIAWLSNREIGRSLNRARASEKNLEIERDNLEQRITIRAQELVETEEKYIQELERSSQFGKLSQGLFHDLMSPLSSISLHAEQLQTSDTDREKLYPTIHKIVEISHRMNVFMDSLKHHMQHNTCLQQGETADLVHEIRIARDVLLFKSRMANVDIVLTTPASLCIYANPIRIHQLILNLISNAIESFSNMEINSNAEKLITISLSKNNENILLSVTDTGCGISDENIANIFKKQFTTKLRGTGNGLQTIHSIVTEELDGKISILSELSKGTQFIITIPLTLTTQHVTRNHPTTL